VVIYTRTEADDRYGEGRFHTAEVGPVSPASCHGTSWRPGGSKANRRPSGLPAGYEFVTARIPLRRMRLSG